MILIEKVTHKGTVVAFNTEGVIVARDCTKCKDFKPICDFSKHKKLSYGYTPYCKKCDYSNPKRKEVKAKYRASEKGKQAEKEYNQRPYVKKSQAANAAKYRKQDPQKQSTANKKHYYKNQQYMLDRARKHKLKNLKYYRDYNRQYKKLNPNLTGRTKRTIRERTVLKDKSVLANIVEIYKFRNYLNNIHGPSKYVVDHIVPIKGKNVSGLHVPWNLTVISFDENAYKKNKFDFTYENESWKDGYIKSRSVIL